MNVRSQPDSGPILDRFIRGQAWLDRLADPIQAAVGGIYGALGPLGRVLKDLMHGTKPIGHPLHPALTDLPLGAWVVGVVLDIAALQWHAVPVQAGDIALAVGTLGALAAAVTGYTDFHETFGLERRTALTHGLTMTVVVAIEIVSFVLRMVSPGTRPLAVGLAIVAVLLAGAGMYVGGHVSFGFGTMVDHNAFSEGPADQFVRVGASDEFPDNQMKRVEAGGLATLVVRLNGELCAIGATCSHAGGPLDEGSLQGSVVTCPWHGSRFDVCSGRVIQGPATFRQPAFRVREIGGQVEVMLTAPRH